jgi:7-carboxy-7-deazaguanine synthase
MTEPTLQVFRVFASLQGESTHAGLPCAFVRLAGCPLCCSYCDTTEARHAAGETLAISRIVARVRALGPRLVEVTGGEPLAQPATRALLTALADAGLEVLLETSGAFPIAGLDARARVVMDIKTPGSGMDAHNRADNLTALVTGRDEVKFVITGRADFDWAVDFVRRHDLAARAALLASPVAGAVAAADLADWILASGQPFRLQLQLHKLVWPDTGDER